MRTITLIALLVACGGKKAPPEKPAPAAAPAPQPTPDAVRPPDPAPAPAPAPDAAVRAPEPKPDNADFNVLINYADGSNAKGHVVRVERSEDWFGEEGWTDAPNKLKVDLESGGKGAEVPWSEIKSVTIRYLGREDISCDMNSEFTPVMYQCTLKTETQVTTKDGKQWTASNRHKWKFVTQGGESLEFWIFKLPARQQEAAVPELGTTDENVGLYKTLQDELMKTKTGKVPTTITITAP